MSGELAELKRLEEVVPAEWRQVTLGKVVRIVTDGISAADLAALPRVHHYSLPAFDQGAGPEVGPGDTIKSNKTVVPNDCVLFSKLNPRIPRIWRVHGEAPPHSCCSTEFWPLVAQGSGVDLDYLTHYLSSAAFLGHRDITPSSSTNSHQRVDRKAFERFEFALPPLDEQRRIAEVLRSVDEAIAATQRTVKAASTVRQVALDDMIQRVLDGPGSEVRPLSDVAEVRTGLAKNKNRAGPKVHVPYLRVANVQDGWFDLADMQEIEVDPGQLGRYLLQAGDVLLTEGGDYDKLGRGGVWRGQIFPCLHQNHVFCVRPDPSSLLPDYFALATQSVWGRAYFLTCAKRTTNLASINSSQLRAFPVPVVPTKTQAGLVEEMAGIDTMIDLEEQQLESLLRLRVEVSSDLLSGDVRVPA